MSWQLVHLLISIWAPILDINHSFLQIGAMIKYLEDKYGERASCGDKSNLQIMRNEAQRLEQLVNEMKEK